MAGIYVHIPFCRSFCIYCDFYSELSFDGGSESFLKSLSCELSLRSGTLSEPVRTLYFGGGTPSLLPVAALERIVGAIRSRYDLSCLEEFTLEVNPDDIRRYGMPGLTSLRRLGIDRISMGVQSFDDGILAWMNRRHDSKVAAEAYWMLREAGFDNISLDLIFGFEGLGRDKWRSTVQTALSLPGGAPEHVSAYCMSLEPGSALYALWESGKYSEPDEDAVAGQYSMLQHMLSEAGYVQYEVSNFARPGRHSRHNSSYWTGKQYLGFGPSAHSMTIDAEGRKTRSWNEADLGKYLSGKYQGGCEVLTPEEQEHERIMLGLRCSAGAVLPESKAVPLVGRGLLAKLPTGRYRIPEEKFFISEYIIRELL